MQRIRLTFLSNRYLICTSLLMLSTMLVSAGNAKSVNFLDPGIKELQLRLTAGEISSRQLVDAYLQRIEAYDQNGPKLNAISVINKKALQRATQLDKERAQKGARGPLHGIPILIKDNYETHDMQTAVGSNVFKGWMAPHDATIVKRLRDAGAIIIAKTNTHEFAMGVETKGSLFGQTLNPYALDRIPGGSSGGTAAAVAANYAPAGFGSDTCGSIRAPASHNSLVGLRSTIGLSSRSGIFPLANSWDTGGPLTQSVSDLAIIYDVIAGYDPADPATAASVGHIPDTYTAFLKTDGLRNQRLGLLTDLLMIEPEDKEVAGIIRTAAEDMRKAGAEVVELTIPGLRDLLHDDFGGFKTIITDVQTDIDAFLDAHPTAPVGSVADIVKSEFLQDALIRGNLQTSINFKTRHPDDYISLQHKREIIRQKVLVAMVEEKVDALIYPTMRQQAARISETQSGVNCFLSGQINFPAISVPAGFTADGLPVGVELLARQWQEPLLIQLAYAFEQATKHRRLPQSTPAR